MKIALPRDRKARTIFGIAATLPPLCMLALSIVLPLLRDPLAEFAIAGSDAPSSDVHKSDAPPRQAATDGKADSAIQQLLLKKKALELEQAYLLSRLSMAASDSVALAVDLTDSTAFLEIRGVPVRRCKITRFAVSGGLQRLRLRGETVTWLSTPFVVREAAASLPKAPIRVRQAPTDTIEAKEKAEGEIPIEKRDVYFTLHFDKNLSLTVAQTQRTSAIGWLQRAQYVLARSWLTLTDDVGALVRLKRPAGRVHIRLQVSREDAKAIYRALPAQARVALRL